MMAKNKPTDSPSVPSLEELAELCSCPYEGDGETEIHGVCSCEEPEEGKITYVISRRYLEKLLSSKVRPAAIVVPPELAKEASSLPLIVAENPKKVFGILMRRLAPASKPAANGISPKAEVHRRSSIDPTAYVGPGCVIEEGAVIGGGSVLWAQIYVGRDTRIGRNCILHPGVVIREECILQDGVIVHSGSIIGSDGFGYVTDEYPPSKIPQLGRVVIENDVEIGSLVCIDRATMGETRIGAHTKIDNLVQIGHNVKIGKGCFIVSQVGISGSTIIEDRCMFAGQSATSGHLRIGPGTRVAARGVVTKDWDGGGILSGFPARPHRERLKMEAELRRLPLLARRLKELEDKVRELEAKCHDTTS